MKALGLCKQKGPSLNHQNPCEILGISAHACNSSIDGQRGAAHDTARLAERGSLHFSERPFLGNRMRMKQEDA